MDLPDTVSPQLLETLQSRQEKLFFQEALSLYIPPQVGRHVGDDAPQDAAECISAWLLDNQSSCLLLMGDSGAGKTLFGQWLTRYCVQNFSRMDRIPLFIPLLVLKNPHCNMLDTCLKTHLGLEERHQRDAILAQPLLLILDGFDEMRERKNLFLSNELWRLKDVKVIVSCRSQALAHEQNEKTFFYPYDKREQVQPLQLKEYVMVPFTEKQIDAYLQQYVMTHQDEIKAKCLLDLSANIPNWLAWKTYQTAIAQLPGLASLLKSPFMLSVVVQILPALFAKYQGKEKIEQHRLVKIDLYDEFVKQWFARQKVKLLKSGHIKKDNSPIEEVFEQYSKGIANAMLQTHMTSIELTPQYLGPLLEQQGIFSENAASEIQKTPTRPMKSLTGTSPKNEASSFLASFSPYEAADRVDPNMTETTKTKKIIEKKYIDADISVGDEKIKLSIILSGCPVMKVQDNRYAFLHKSLLEYFAAKQLLEGVTAEASIAMGFELNERLLVDEPATLQFLAERVQQDDMLKQRLFAVIEESKIEGRVEIASANAITILNKAGVSFSQKSLRHIRIKGADLSSAILDSADLRDADLREVNLRSAWLNQAKLGGALMQKVEFGELSYLEVEEPIICIAYSPDGCFLAAGCEDGSIRFLDVASGKCIATLKGHTNEVNSLAFSPDGLCLASGSWDARLWDVKTQKCIGVLKGRVRSVAFSPDGRIFASVYDNTVCLWEHKNQKLLGELKGHEYDITSIAFSPNGKILASGSEDKSVRLWDVENYKFLGKLEKEEHNEGRVSVTFSPDGKILAVGSIVDQESNDGVVYLWECESQQLVGEIKGSIGCVSLAYSLDGRVLAFAGNMDKRVYLWDIESRKFLTEMKGHTHWVTSIIFSPDGKTLASLSRDKFVRLWDVENQKPLGITKENRNWVRSLAFSPDGEVLACGCNDKSVRLWNTENPTFLAEMIEHTGWVKSIAFNSKQRILASLGDMEFSIYLWEWESQKLLSKIYLRYELKNLVFSLDGKHLAAVNYYRNICLWGTENQKLLAEMEGHTSAINCVAFNPDGSYLASGSDDKSVRLWDVQNQESLGVLNGHTDAVKSVAFSPDGSYLASGSNDKSVRLWDVQNQKLLAEMKGHTSRVESVAFSPYGKILASGSNDNSIRLWDSNTGKCVGNLQLKSYFNAFAFKKSGEKIYLSISSGEAIYTFEIKRIQSKLNFILLWAIGNEAGLRGEQLDLGGVVGLEPQHERLLKQREAVGNLSQRETEKVLRDRTRPIPYNPQRPPYNLFGQQHLITPNSAMVNLVRKTKGADTSKHVFLVIEQIDSGFYILTRADLYLDKTQKYSQGWIVTEGQALVEISVKPLRDMQLLVRPDADVSPEDKEKYEPCVYKSWPISAKQARNLIITLEADRLRRLFYHNLGNNQGKETYNCLTWCEKHLALIGIDVSEQQSWLDVIVAHPKQHLPDSLDKDNQEPDFGEKCLVM